VNYAIVFITMGLVLKTLRKDDKYTGYEPNFDTAGVDEKSQDQYHEILEKLGESKKLLIQLNGYKTSQDRIRDAMNTNSAENKRLAFESTLENVKRIKICYKYCNEDLVKLFQDLRERIREVEEEKLEDKEQLKKQEAWAKELARLISFVVEWDQGKMQKPTMLNDFSYYKRNLPQQAANFNLVADTEESLASSISFWLAESMPMCKTLGESLKAKESLRLLKDISALCYHLVESKKFVGTKTPQRNEVLCLRCAVGCIVLYDRASGGHGAFGSKTFRTKKICEVLSKYQTANKEMKDLCMGLKRVIQYGSMSFRDYATAKETEYIIGN